MIEPVQFNRALPAVKKSKTGFWIIFFIISIVLILILNKPLGALSYNFFVIGDNILKLSNYISPVIMWGVCGALFGSIIGSIIAAIKYKLPFKWISPSLGLNIAVLSVLSLVSEPLLTNANGKTVKRLEGYEYVEVIASSSIPKYDQYTFGPDNLLDNDDNTAWMYIETNNKPACLQFIFKGDAMNKATNVKLSGFNLRAGYQKNYDKFDASNKPKDYTVYKNDVQIQVGVFENRFGNQKIPFEDVKINLGDIIKIKITSSYKPTVRNINIISISDMYPILTLRKPIY